MTPVFAIVVSAVLLFSFSIWAVMLSTLSEVRSLISHRKKLDEAHAREIHTIVKGRMEDLSRRLSEIEATNNGVSEMAEAWAAWVGDPDGRLSEIEATWSDRHQQARESGDEEGQAIAASALCTVIRLRQKVQEATEEHDGARQGQP